MLSRLFGRNKPADNPKPGPQLGMLALKSLDGLDPGAVTAAWARLFPGIPKLTASPTEKPGDNSVMAFSSGSQSLMLASMPAPIPWGDIDYAVKFSWMWKAAATEMKAQKAHAVALCVPGNKPVQEALAVARLLCSAAAAGQPVGIYWGNGLQVHAVPFFTDAVQSMAHDDSLPVMLWIGLGISGKSKDGPLTLTSHGLRSFGHKELEIIDTTKGIGDLRMMAYELINYLLNSGPVLQHGHTFGSSQSERFTVDHTTSQFRKGEPVIRLHVP